MFRSDKLAELESLFDSSNPPLDIEAMQETDIPFTKKELLYRIQLLEKILADETKKRQLDTPMRTSSTPLPERDNSATAKKADKETSSTTNTKADGNSNSDSLPESSSHSKKKRTKSHAAETLSMSSVGLVGLFIAAIL